MYRRPKVRACEDRRAKPLNPVVRALGHQRDASADRDGPVVGRLRVELGALALPDHDVAADQRADLDGRGARRLVLLDPDAVREYTRAHATGALVLPRPGGEHGVAAGRRQRVHIGGPAELLDAIELRPLRTRADPGQLAVRPRRHVARGWAERVDRRPGVREQPRRADERMARERQFDGRREDAQRAGLAVVDEHGLGEPEVGSDRLAPAGRDGAAVEDHAERVASAAAAPRNTRSVCSATLTSPSGRSTSCAPAGSSAGTPRSSPRRAARRRASRGARR